MRYLIGCKLWLRPPLSSQRQWLTQISSLLCCHSHRSRPHFSEALGPHFVGGRLFRRVHCPTSPIASATHTLCHPYSYLVSINNQPHITRTDHAGCPRSRLSNDSPASVRSASA